jgi:hypothetical protein
MKEVIHSILALITIITLGFSLRGLGVERASSRLTPVITDSMAPIFRSTGVVGVIASGVENQAMPDERNMCEQGAPEEESPEQAAEKTRCANMNASIGIIEQVIQLFGRQTVYNK